ncbi:UNVERIFIED_CONTAM: Retrovirus-related Pol polyprotein from transposon RE2 [Sesamum latifolium]|uniref:Retrovirus-related Pol polyprotein from transposon RE2 n=1 Tax=Sesamum latifolium TaxID=2727402 RepID=A0AAW2X299_9LAMI
MEMNEAGVVPGSGSNSASGWNGARESEDLKVHTSNFPGMILVSTPLTRNNFLLWSRSVKVALTAKMKLSFIYGTYPKPTENSDECKQWIRTDSMVMSWIQNSISKDIAKAFSYAKSARSLWLQLESRFGQANRPMIYNLQREITSISQGNMDVVSYFTKITMLWDELECVDPTPDYSVDKAYSLVLRIESQRQGSATLEEANHNVAMMVKGTDFKRETGNRTFQQRKQYGEKRSLYCIHCAKSGHSKETCFKLHGYPDWFKEMTEKRKKSRTDARAMSAISGGPSVPHQEVTSNQPLSVMMNEILQLMKGKTQAEQAQAHFAKMGEFASTDLQSKSDFLYPNSWIVDSGATTHMCASRRLFRNLRSQAADSSIFLPDGSKTHVTHSGSVILSPEITLTPVLYVPSFQCNLLSVSRLTDSSQLLFVFSCDHCTLQDRKTKRILAVGKLLGRLYVIDDSSFSIDNGVVERKHKHLLQIARALMFQSSLPSQFWTEALLTATYIVNRLPTSVLCWKTPYEVLYQKPVDYAWLKVFGCLVFATNVIPHKSKFTKRAHKCVFLGYALGQKGYKLYDVDEKVMFVSRDVVFHETIFLYEKVSASESDYPLPIPMLDEDPVVPHTNPVLVSDSSPDHATAVPHIDPVHISDSFPDHATFELSDGPTTDGVISPAIRRSSRQITKPCWLNDFVCSYAHFGSGFTVTSIAPSHQAFTASLSLLQEPTTYQQASSSPEWKSAMQAELDALESNHTWEVTPLPSGKIPIGCRWVFKLKLHADSSIDRHKARLVAKGYNQVEGIDYNESFSPVAKTVTVRLFFAIAAARGWHIHQMDVNNAFLHGYLEEEVFMHPPEGYIVLEGHVCRLKRPLYGLKQASSQWNLEFTTQIAAFGFLQSKHDYCLFTKQLDQGLAVTQSKYVRDIISDVGLLGAWPATTPLPPGIRFTNDASALLPHPDIYRRLVGRLLYLSFTRPDLSYACQQLSQYLQHPCQQHMEAALHLVRYLKGTLSKGLFFPSHSSFTLTGYSDADWASCRDTRRSLTGYCILFGTALVSWKMKKQNTISRSTAEVEYRSMGSAVCELSWIVYLLQNFGISIPTPVPFLCDNQVALHIVANPVFHERTKHLEIDCHIVLDKFKSGLIAPSHVSSTDQLANLFTKSLLGPPFFRLLSKLGLVDLTPSPTCGGVEGNHSSCHVAEGSRQSFFPAIT